MSRTAPAGGLGGRTWGWAPSSGGTCILASQVPVRWGSGFYPRLAGENTPRGSGAPAQAIQPSRSGAGFCCCPALFLQEEPLTHTLGFRGLCLALQCSQEHPWAPCAHCSLQCTGSPAYALASESGQVGSQPLAPLHCASSSLEPLTPADPPAGASRGSRAGLGKSIVGVHDRLGRGEQFLPHWGVPLRPGGLVEVLVHLL